MNAQKALKQTSRLQKRITWGIALSLLLSVVACQPRQSDRQPEPETSSISNLDRRLALSNATLEQANAEGETLWKIQAERAAYSQNQKEARLEKITANVFENGELVLQISANIGNVLEDGEKFLLEDRVIATDPRNGATIRSDRVEWHPQDNVLIVQQNLKGNYQDLEVTAKEGRYYTQTQRLELLEDIVATAQEPPLQMKTEDLIWDLTQRKLTGALTEIVRYRDNIVSDRAVGDRSEVDLNTDTAFLQNNVELKSLEPLVTVATNSLTWKYKEQIASSDQPVQIVHSEDEITVTGNQAQVDLEKKIARLQGGIKGTNRQANLYSNELTWNLPNQTVEATGNVVYQQVNPQLNLTGVRAVGNLLDNNITVSGNSGERVVTNIVP